MFRCALVEFFSLGGGHALAGSLRRAAIWHAVTVLAWLAVLWTPFAAFAVFAIRLAAVVTAGRAGRRGPPAGGWAWKPALALFAISVGVLITMRTQAVEMFKVPSVSMAPTLGIDDMIVGDKLSLRWRAPERGEILVFRVGPRDFVGRVIALGGDVVAVRDGRLWLNGVAVPTRELGPVELLNRDDMTMEIETDKAIAFTESLAGHNHRVVHQPSEGNGHDYPLPERGCAGFGGADFDGEPLEPAAEGCRVRPGTFFFMGDNRDNSNDSRSIGAIPLTNVRARVGGIWLGGIEGRLSRIGAID